MRWANLYLTGPPRSMATWVTSALDQWRIPVTATGFSLAWAADCSADCVFLELDLLRAAAIPAWPRTASSRAAITSDRASENGSGVRKSFEAQPVTPGICLTVYTGRGGFQTARSGDVGWASRNLKRC